MQTLRSVLRFPWCIATCTLIALFGIVQWLPLSNVSLAEAKQPKVDICHYDADTDTYSQISVAEPAVPAHAAHGDPAIGGVCTVGVGVCEATGVLVCSEGGAVCDAVPGVPGEEEICGDGLDNDCDGEVDEECVG